MQNLKLVTNNKEAKKCNQVKIAVIGCGYWGPKLVRNFSEIKTANIYGLCDLNISKAKRVGESYAPEATIETDYHILLSNPEISGVVIATPIKEHYKIAKEALLANKHVFVEKPLALTVKECQDLISIAKQKNLVLMVGHVYRYNTDIQLLKEYIESDILGNILYIQTRRLNLGKIQSDLNAMWSFAPHDISILLYLLGEFPMNISANGSSYLDPHNIEDVVFLKMQFPSGVDTYSHFSWLYPKKIRDIVIVGSKKMLIYDDVAIEDKIQIFDKDTLKTGTQLKPNETSFYDFQKNNKYTDIIIPKIPYSEPLKLECNHFIQCIQTQTQPLTDGNEGLNVVRILESAQKSLKSNTGSVEVTLCG